MKQIFKIAVLLFIAAFIMSCDGGGSDKKAKRIYKVTGAAYSAMNPVMELFYGKAYAGLADAKPLVATFDENGKVIKVTTANGAIEYIYHYDGNTISSVDVDDMSTLGIDGTLSFVYAATTTTITSTVPWIDSSVRTYDVDGKILQEVTGAVTGTFEYNGPDGKLSKVTSTDMGTFTITYNGNTREVSSGAKYEYDENGNCTYWDEGGGTDVVDYTLLTEEGEGDNTWLQWYSHGLLREDLKVIGNPYL